MLKMDAAASTKKNLQLLLFTAWYLTKSRISPIHHSQIVETNFEEQVASQH